ncbi:MAG: diaminobutyrate decarboxylase [Pseudomonadales bacterium]|nr:diaminobutyrate decarboxylase [Pseudomonadales bacterium]
MSAIDNLEVCLRSVGEEEDFQINKNTLHDVFSPQLFRRNAGIAIEKLEQHLSDRSIRGLDLIDPDILLQTVKNLMSEQAGMKISDEDKLKAIINLYINTGIQVHSPGYMGRQFSGVIPLAGVFDLVSSIVNQPSSFYEAAQLPSVVERIMADELNQFIGWPEGQFAMVTTSGGSLANLTAILAARNDKFPQFWSEGVAGLHKKVKPAIAVSEDSHYSVSRAAGIIGIGEDQIIRLPTNAKKQICLDKVQHVLDKAEQSGLKVFCLVASVGTTSMGAFDPIDELAEISREREIWLHVDGAHGASLLVSDQHRLKLKGIEKADSFVLDAHKMLFVPAMCTLLFYKNKQKSYCAFNQEASYVFEKKPDIYTEYDSAEQNFECTKRPLIMNLWVCWMLYGKSLFANKIDHLCHITQSVYQQLLTEHDFETLHSPEINILCFRYFPDGLEPTQIGDFQLMIRNRIRKDGKFFISKVDIDGTTALRVVFMNHEVTLEHFNQLLTEIRRIGLDLLQKVSNSNQSVVTR